MSKKYSIAEARANLPSIVTQAEAGLDIELTRRGKSVVLIISRRKLERLLSERPRFGQVYRDFLKKYDLARMGLDENFASSLREEGSGRKVSL